MKSNRQKMKRALAFIVSATMIIGLCGCGKSEKKDTEIPTILSISEEVTASTTEVTLPDKKEALKEAPEAYLDAILVQINPSFMLFVNERGEVVRSKAMNEDAKSMLDHVALDGRNVKDALTDIVRSSVDDGYLKSGGTVNISMMETFRTESDAKQNLKELENVVVDIGREKNTDIHPVTKIAEDVSFAQDEPQPGPNREPNQDPNQDQNVPPPEQDQRTDPKEDPNPPSDHDDHDDHDHNNEDGGNSGSGGGKKEGCPVCHGSGVCVRCNKTGYVECGACHGSGKADCHMCDNGYDSNPCPCGGDGKCYRCQGSGEFEGKTCDVCAGNGKCKECGGIGKRPCKNCGATGIIDCNECHGSGKEKCQGCQGTLKCEACDGTGLNLHK
ncbi:MAG: hypothetical protein J6U23_12690 [Clostridiales bacterium]|nr:hypothetical protein [Clostridiales bacterium]MBP5417638.1 hypothetical protein [Clostridiales bacterium]